jgi:sigma-B regulation protein RsbU (phosphoserine phosphatase)
MRIQGKMTLIVLSTGIITLITLCGIMFYSMIGARNMAIQYSNEIGKQSNENSSMLLEEQKRRELIAIAADKADEIDYRLNDMEKCVKIAAATMQKIHEHHQDYRPLKNEFPPANGAGKLIFYVQYAKNIDIEALAYEMGISANIRDTLIGLVECDPLIDSIFVASRHNYIFSVDNNINTSAEEYEPSDLYYDALASDWYRLAEKSHGAAFTPVREFVYSKQLGIFCAVPYYNAEGELEGVSCLQTTLKDLNDFVAKVNLHNTGFCFVIDERGHVILSSDGNGKRQGALSVNLQADRRNSEDPAIAEMASRMVAGEKGIAEVCIDGKQYYAAYAPVRKTGWSFAAAIAAGEVLAPIARNNEGIRKLTEQNIHLFNQHMAYTMTATVFLVLVLLGAVSLVGRKVSKRFVKPLHVLADGVREIASGNLDKKIHIDSGDEIEHLANSFNGMTDSLKKYIDDLALATEEQERQNVILKRKNLELTAALNDVEKMRIARDSYRAESEIDHLTKVYNKITIEHICNNRCANMRDGMQAALYIVDLDHFKDVNDTLGHQYGDRILSEFALQLKLLCRKEDCVGRFGGDEFIVMIMGILTEDVIRNKARAILRAARELHIDGEPSGITASIGIAVAPMHGTDYSSLFQAADKALYRVKGRGRDGFCIG